MKDPNCMYCTQNERQQSLMIHFADLPSSKVYLFKEQTYYGRCVIAYKDHVKELFDLSDGELAAFMKDVARVAKAINATVGADKINYGLYGDKVPHLHFHLVPKKEGGRSFGGSFEISCEPPTILSDKEYAELIEKLKSNL